MKKKAIIITVCSILAVAILVGAGFLIAYLVKPETPQKVIQAKIESASDFEALTSAEYVKSASNLIELETDLTLDFRGKTPIFNSVDRAYRGTFDGKGHTLKISYDTVSESGSAGLFGFLSGATVKNLDLEIELSGNTAKLRDDATFIGGVAGVAFGENTVENVTIKLTAVTEMTVKTAVDINDVTRSFSDNAQYVGGIFGYAAGKVKIKNCETKGFSVVASDKVRDATTDFKDEVRDKLFVGGAFGHASGRVETDGFKATFDRVDLYGKTVSFGGFAGVIEGGTVENIEIGGTADIKTVNTVKGYVGGVAGYALDTAVSEYETDLSFDASATVLCALSFGGAAGFVDGSTFADGKVSVTAELDFATAFGGIAGVVTQGKILRTELSGGIYGEGGQSVSTSALQRIIDMDRAYFGTLVGRLNGGSEVSGNTVLAGYPTAPEAVGLISPYVPVDSEGNLGTAVNPVVSGNTIPARNPA